jgi:membrane-associated protease RseP (regulator of RpoE activity)
VGERRLEFSVVWSALAVGSLTALAFLAPSGLYLVGFLGLIIITHEAGHFLVARRSGMVPTELFWGFGPEVAAVQVGECRYGIKALFLGGYVRLEGMTPQSELPDGFDEAGTYRAASHRGRLATILAGPAVNLVMAVVAFAGAAMIGGAGPVGALRAGVADVWFVIHATGEALWIWASNLGGYAAALWDGSNEDAPVRFLSPVAQADVSRQAVGLGMAASLQWFAILSAAIGAINLLPLPPLDGSHAVVAGAEGVAQRTRRDHSIRFDVHRLLPLAYVTVAVLVTLSVSALVMDIRDLT